MTALAPFAPGDIFVTASNLDETARFPTGMGAVLQFAADWQPKARFETGKRGLISALCLDTSGNLHILDPQARAFTTVGPDGKPFELFTKLAPRAYGSMITLADGNFLLGEHMVGEIPGFSGSGKVYRVGPDGECLAEYNTETNGGVGGFLGVTHMALSADGKTLFHSSETGAHVYAHDLQANRRLGPIYTRADPPPMVFGIAAGADEALIVACGSELRRVANAEATSWPMPEGRGWAVPVMRHNRAEAYALDFFGGRLARLNSQSGELIELRELGLAKCLTGIAEMPA